MVAFRGSTDQVKRTVSLEWRSTDHNLVKTKSSSIADLRLKARRHQEAILRSLSSLSDDLDG